MLLRREGGRGHKRKRNWSRAFCMGGLLAFVLLLVLFGIYVGIRPSRHERVRSIYDRLVMELDQTFFGRGYDVVRPDVLADYPMAYGMIASSLAKMYQATHWMPYLNDAVKTADWLLANADMDQDGIIGWGLPLSVRGGSVTYPPNHEYTITMAFVVQGLLDVVAAIEMAGESGVDPELEARRNSYQKTALAAIEEVISRKCLNEYADGRVAFWYSCLPCDAGYEATNVIAMMAGALQRISNCVNDPERRIIYRSLADGSVSFLVSQVAERDDGGWYWDYRLDGIGYGYIQDLVHTGYTAWGLLTYLKYGGKLSACLPVDRIVKSFAGYQSAQKGLLIRFIGGNEHARLWGAAFQLAALALANADCNLVRNAFLACMQFYREDGVFRFSYDDDSIYIRAEAAILLGLSEYYHYIRRQQKAGTDQTVGRF